jgi:hypothetical protein
VSDSQGFAAQCPRKDSHEIAFDQGKTKVCDDYEGVCTASCTEFSEIGSLDQAELEVLRAWRAADSTTRNTALQLLQSQPRIADEV